jgi:hypothetical protein
VLDRTRQSGRPFEADFTSTPGEGRLREREVAKLTEASKAIDQRVQQGANARADDIDCL